MKRVALLLAGLMMMLLLAGCDAKEMSKNATAFLNKWNRRLLSVSSESNENVDSEKLTVSDYVMVQLNDSFRDEEGEEHTFRVPHIAVTSTDAARINATIEKEFLKPAKQSLEDYRNDDHPTFSTIDYSAYLNGKALTLLLSSQNRLSGEVKYRVYNLNVESGEIMELTELRKQAGLGAVAYQQYLDAAIAAQTKATLREYYGENASDEKLERSYEYSCTMSESNLAKIKPFLRQDSEMWILMDVYYPGAGMHQQLVQLQKIEES